MKKLLIGIILLLSAQVKSQDLPSNFEIETCIEVNKADSVLFYYDCMGKISNKKNALFMRKGKVDSTDLYGIVNDYYITGEKAFTGNITNGLLEGEAIYYFKNGQIKSVGHYRQGERVDIWKYYYKNGKIEKILNFGKDYPLIVEYYKKNGKQLITEGNGKYKGTFRMSTSCTSYLVQGVAENGKISGKWIWYPSSSNTKNEDDIFVNIEALKGESIGFSIGNQNFYIKSYYVSEHVNIIGKICNK